MSEDQLNASLEHSGFEALTASKAAMFENRLLKLINIRANWQERSIFPVTVCTIIT